MVDSPSISGNKSWVFVNEYAYTELRLKPFLAMGFSKNRTPLIRPSSWGNPFFPNAVNLMGFLVLVVYEAWIPATKSPRFFDISVLEKALTDKGLGSFIS